VKIFTHTNLDLDAACSVWAVRQFVPGAKNAQIEFRPSNWEGEEIEDEDFAVDISAGGKGIKGKKDDDGTIHSSFATIVEVYASQNDKEALCGLVKFVDAQDSYGSALKFLAPGISRDAQEALGSTGINSVLRALQKFHGSDKVACERMSEIISGLLEFGRSRKFDQEEAQKAEILPCGKVAIVRDCGQNGVNGILFERGIRVIVYVDGNNIGLIRNNEEKTRMDHSDIRAVVEDAGEIKEWFAHTAGFLFCRGSRKAPATNVSKVSPIALAKTMSEILDNKLRE